MSALGFVRLLLVLAFGGLIGHAWGHDWNAPAVLVIAAMVFGAYLLTFRVEESACCT